jgi:rare lipoprotein A
MAWTAAIHTDLRETFGGVRYGKDYRPAYALVEVADKRAIVKINDVGPLKPGRVIDFNQQTMHYFDPSLQLGIVHSVKITPLPGDGWAAGPMKLARE